MNPVGMSRNLCFTPRYFTVTPQTIDLFLPDFRLWVWKLKIHALLFGIGAAKPIRSAPGFAAVLFQINPERLFIIMNNFL